MKELRQSEKPNRGHHDASPASAPAHPDKRLALIQPYGGMASRRKSPVPRMDPQRLSEGSEELQPSARHTRTDTSDVEFTETTAVLLFARICRQ